MSKKSKPKILSDSDVDELYTKLETKKEQSDSSKDMLTNFRQTNNSTLQKTTDFIDKIEHSKPLIDKIKNQSANEINEFTSKSTSALTIFGSKLKSISKKYADKTKSELDESKNFIKTSVPVTTNKINKEWEKSSESIKNNVPKIGRKTKNAFLDSIEKIYGASTIGKQYGVESVNLLVKLGELKTAGLITTEEFDSKKKEILKRI